VEGARATSLAKSTAGTSGFAFKNCCRLHRAPLNAPRACQACRQGQADTILRLLRLRDSLDALTLRVEALTTIPKLADRQAEAARIAALVGADLLPEVTRRLSELAEITSAEMRTLEAAQL